MKIFSSPYELVAKADGRRRSGSLIKVEFDDGLIGYADVHPWTQFGDEHLSEQLKALAVGEPKNLGEHSLNFARQDAIARAEHRWLFQGLNIPQSHKSLPFGFSDEDFIEAKEEGFHIFKLKQWSFNDQMLYLLKGSECKFRIDFNGSQEVNVADQLRNWGAPIWIDWIEDPGPFNHNNWSSLRRNFGVRIAVDFENQATGDAYDVFVLKPARTDLNDFQGANQTLSITSYLDHPIGQMFAAWTAGIAVKQGLAVETCGLITHTVYEENLFSRSIKTDGPTLIPPRGTGIGFDEELASLEWTLVQ